MSIQGNVNQIISLSGLLATQHPGIRAAAQKRTALRTNKQALNAVEERYNLGRQEQLKAYQEGRPIEEAGAIGPVAQEKADLLKERYKLDPSIENWEAHKEALLEAEEITKSEEMLDARSAEGEAFLENFKEQRERVPIEERLQFEVDASRAKADASLITEQTNRRETRDRAKGFTSQSYGTWGRTDNKAFKGGSR